MQYEERFYSLASRYTGDDARAQQKFLEKLIGDKTTSIQQDDGEKKGKQANEATLCLAICQYWLENETEERGQMLGNGWELRFFTPTASGRKPMGDNTCPDFLAEWRNKTNQEQWVHFFEVKIIERKRGKEVDPAIHYGDVTVNEITDYRSRSHGLTIGLEVLPASALNDETRPSHDARVIRWKAFCEVTGIGLWLFSIDKTGSLAIERKVCSPGNDETCNLFVDGEDREKILKQHIPPDCWPISGVRKRPLCELKYIMHTHNSDWRNESCEAIEKIIDAACNVISCVQGGAKKEERKKCLEKHGRYRTPANISELRNALKTVWDHHDTNCSQGSCCVKKKWKSADDFAGPLGRPPEDIVGKAKKILSDRGYA